MTGIENVFIYWSGGNFSKFIDRVSRRGGSHCDTWAGCVIQGQQ